MEIRPLIGLAGVIAATMAAEFSDQVTALALNDIRGGLGISHDPGTWLTTAYVCGEAVGASISPWLAVTFSLRRFVLFAIGLSCVSSLLVPTTNIDSLLYTLRVVQGLAEGLTIPLLMTTALRVLPPPIRLYGLAAYALTATMFPNLGTSLAALWTDVLHDWRFAFFQTIPFCAAAFMLASYGMPVEAPKYERFRQFDWRGVLLVAIGFPSLVVMLEQGDRYDWFNSPTITALSLAAAVAIPLLFVNEYFHPLPLLRVQLLARRNFAYGTITLILFLIIATSASLVPATFLQTSAGFRPIQIHLLTLEIAVIQVVMLPAMALLLDRPWIDARVVSFVGMTLMLSACAGAFLITPIWDAGQFVWWQALQGIGQPMIVMPLLMMTTNTVKPDEGPFASALVNGPRAMAEAAGTWLLALIMRWRGGLHTDRLLDQYGQERFRLPMPGGAGRFYEAVRAQAMALTISDAFLVFGALVVMMMVILLTLPVRAMPPRIALAQH